MPLQFETKEGTNIVTIEVSGKLSSEDYEKFVPPFEELIQKYGKLRILFIMRDFHGWDMSALWQDTKFDVKHYKDVERLAMVGDKTWQKGMSVICKPFTTAKIQYFDLTETQQAFEWIEQP